MLLGALGVIGDLLAAQRTLTQRTFERVRRIELQLGIEPSHYEPGRPAREAFPDVPDDVRRETVRGVSGRRSDRQHVSTSTGLVATRSSDG